MEYQLTISDIHTIDKALAVYGELIDEDDAREELLQYESTHHIVRGILHHQGHTATQDPPSTSPTHQAKLFAVPDLEDDHG